MSTARLGISGRIAGFFQSAQITPLLALVALLLGAFAVLVTPREEEPQINVTMANVIIPFAGASVRDVEQMVSGFGRPVGLHFLPEDRATVDRALVTGRTLLETSAESPLARAILALAAAAAPASPPVRLTASPARKR